MAITITVASAEVDSNLTDFPVGVDLSNMPASFWSNVSDDGSEIRVFNSGLTRLPVDVVRLDIGAEAGWLFFLADSLSSSVDTDFTLDFDGAGEAAFDTDNVWTDYQGVWLLGESPLDRTANDQDLSNSGDPNLFEVVETAPVSNCHEGVATDGANYFGFDSISSPQRIRKFDLDWNQVDQNASLGSGTGNPGINNLGGGTHLNGKLYVIAEVTSTGTQYLAVYDASDLSFIEAFDIESFANSAADVTYNPDDGLLYSIQFSAGGTSTLIKIDPTDGSDQGTVALSDSLTNANGITLWRGAFWVSLAGAADEMARVELDGTVNFGGQFGAVSNGSCVSPDGDGIWAVFGNTPKLWKPYNITLGAGGGGHTDGGNHRIWGNLGAAASSDIFTLSATLTVETTNAFHTVLTTASTLGSTANRAMISTTNTGVWQCFDAANGAMSGTSAVSADTPYRVHVIWDGTSSKTLYVNGSQDVQETSITAIGSSNDVVVIGESNDDPVGGGGTHQGLMGLLQIRYETLSADWIAAEYSMLNDNATFLSVSGTVGPAQPTVTVTGTSATGVSATTSQFSGSSTGTTHDSTQWRIKRVSDGATVYDPGDDTTNLTAIVNAGSTVPLDTESVVYTLEARHKEST